MRCHVDQYMCTNVSEEFLVSFRLSLILAYLFCSIISLTERVVQGMFRFHVQLY
jgi:hypothetical protein